MNYGVRWEPYIPMVWRDDPPGSGIRMYNFSVDGFKAGQKSAVFPGAPAGFTYPAQVEGGPADFEGAAAVHGEVEQARAARRRELGSDRQRATRRFAPATASPTT